MANTEGLVSIRRHLPVGDDRQHHLEEAQVHVLHREVAHVDDLWKKTVRSARVSKRIGRRSDHAMRVSVKQAQGDPGEPPEPPTAFSLPSTIRSPACVAPAAVRCSRIVSSIHDTKYLMKAVLMTAQHNERNGYESSASAPRTSAAPKPQPQTDYLSESGIKLMGGSAK